MAEAVRIGVTSAQICPSCHREASGAPRGGGSTSGGSACGGSGKRQGGRAAVDHHATVKLGNCEVPLAAFHEVAIQRRRALQSEAPEDSEQQNWIQCGSCRTWWHWVCALYNYRTHSATVPSQRLQLTGTQTADLAVGSVGAGGGSGGGDNDDAAAEAARADGDKAMEAGGSQKGGVLPLPVWQCDACRTQKAAAAKAAAVATVAAAGETVAAGGTPCKVEGRHEEKAEELIRNPSDVKTEEGSEAGDEGGEAAVTAPVPALATPAASASAPGPLPACGDNREEDSVGVVAMLPQSDIGNFIEKAVATALQDAGVSASPVHVRIVSSVDSAAQPKDVLLQRQWSSGEAYPAEFPFRSRAVMAAQRVDGHDIIIFMMYTQEYGSDCPEPNKRRVYISYVDSVKYFHSTPPGHRSTVYRSLIAAYLQSCRLRGFKHVHLWVEPPRAGDEYIFFARPPEERKPMKREKLRSWYVKVLEKARADGIISRYGDMLDEFRGITSAREIPMFKGDQWEITVPALMEGNDEEKTAAETSDGGFARPYPRSRPQSSSAAGAGPGVATSTSATSSPSHAPDPSASAFAVRTPTDPLATSTSAADTECSAGGGRSTRLKGLPMAKSESEDLVAKVRKQMRHMQGHFLVATLAELPPGTEPIPQFDPPCSFPVVNNRQALLLFCQTQALQFNSCRYAQYSTLRIVYEMVHPTPPAPPIAESPAYCLVSCRRGQLDDGSMMVGCDVCDNWYHPDCLAGTQVRHRMFVPTTIATWRVVTPNSSPEPGPHCLATSQPQLTPKAGPLPHTQANATTRGTHPPLIPHP